jgi:hypothetical protein
MRGIGFSATLLLGGLLAPCGAGEIVSGPAAGTGLTPVRAYAPLGPYAGREFDAAAEIGNRPGALLFLHEMTRNTYHVIRGLDELAAEHAFTGFRSFTLRLADDRTSAERAITLRNGRDTGGHRFSVVGKFGALHLRNPIALSLDGLDGPGNYALNRKAALTLVIVRDGKVALSAAFTDTGAKDLPTIRKMVEDAIGPLPPDDASAKEWIATRLPQEPGELRKLAIEWIAFQDSRKNEASRFIRLIEEITGPLPKRDVALKEIIASRLPEESAAMKEMAFRQADEIRRLNESIAKLKQGRGAYQMRRPTRPKAR